MFPAENRMITQLGYVGISASELGEWERFATEILGLELCARAPDGTLHLRMDEHHHRLIVHQGKADDLAYVGWQVADAEALDAAVLKLHGAGVSSCQGTTEELAERKVLGLVKFVDPNDCAVELFFAPSVVAKRPFHPGRPISGFKAGRLGVGHVTLATGEEIKRSTDFYCGVLGFRVSDYADLGETGHPNAIFLRCNPRHHSLAIIKASSAKKLLHLLIEVEAIDDVGTALDLCYRNRVQITRGIGKHGNDQMLSCYIKSPSGFDIEYGWGGRLVDDATWVVQQHSVSRAWGAQTGEEERERARALLSLSESSS